MLWFKIVYELKNKLTLLQIVIYKLQKSKKRVMQNVLMVISIYYKTYK